MKSFTSDVEVLYKKIEGVIEYILIKVDRTLLQSNNQGKNSYVITYSRSR